ncbi:MAG: glutamyl-tRNA reductase [Acidobacteria bacterium]|nr:glutamyl-tRNA reductase [Acidobacteriota bacterium]
MEILVLGLSHHSAPLEVRERLWFPAASVPPALGRLAGQDGIREAAILSTCNRTEMIAVAGETGAGFGAISEFLNREREFAPEQVEKFCYRHAGRDAVRHLFRVASSLDSLVVGEPQILGQVKEAFALSQGAGTAGPVLDQLFRRALAAAKRVRTDTGIARNPVSISYAAALLARQIFADLAECSLLLVGTGKMSDLAARHLVGEGVRTVYVASRTYARAEEMARRHSGAPIRFDEFFDYLKKVDVVLTSTAAPHWIVKKEDVLGLMRFRRGRPLYFIDIAVPRDVEPAVHEIDNVYLYDLDDLQSVVDANLAARRGEAAHAESILDGEVGSFLAWWASRDLSPTIVAFRDRLHGIRVRELERFRNRLGPLSPNQVEVIGELTAAIVNKILHFPIQWLKRSAADPDALRSADLVKSLFEIPEDRPSDLEATRKPE